MIQTRLIPCLLLKNDGLVKTIGFSAPTYVGDPINAVRIFNEKEVDELILLDIDASKQNYEPDYQMIKDIVSEAFMPIAYGGGVKNPEQAQHLINQGIEKIILNTIALEGYSCITAIAEKIGSSGTVVSVDIGKDWLGRYRVFNAMKGKYTSLDPFDHIQKAVSAGAGEIFINDVMRDGTGKGYDLELTRKICSSVDVPVIICGGAGILEHLREGADAGASAVAAGSLFIYKGKHRAVMINYPEQENIKRIFDHG